MTARTRDELKTRLIVGMEIHVELATRSKMWTAAPNIAHRDHFDAAPNTLCDPVVLGLPGSLPVMNREALEMSMLVGLALHCTIADRTKWDRKSYYYPDLPKNYQISQYDQPLCEEGFLDIEPTPGLSESASEDPGHLKRIRIIRAHLEEDAGKLLHEAPGGGHIEGSIVDLNRAGTPLLEIVTYPDLSTPDECVRFAQSLRDICRHLGVTEGVMQRGHIRFEPNINVAIEDAAGEIHKTPIVEIKNLNSYKAVRDAVAYEYERQVEAWLETGDTLQSGSKSTRGWDDGKGETFLQREKEEAHDYRYFPDPDLVMVQVDDAWRERVRERMPELPTRRRERYAEAGLDAKQIDAIVGEPSNAKLFDAVVDGGIEPRRIATVLLNNLARRANDRGVAVGELTITPEQVADVIRLQDADKIGSSAADKLFDLLLEEANAEHSAEALASKHGLLQVSDTSALEGFVDQVLADPKNAKSIEDIKGGKDKAIGALMGQIMKLSKGQANAKLVTELIRKRLTR